MPRPPVCIALAVVAMTGCSTEAEPAPSMLSDGSAARPPPVALEGVDGPSVVTRVRRLEPRSARPGSPTARCLGSGLDADAVAVERVGVSGTSVTLLLPARHELYACDGAAGPDGSWCGRAFAHLVTGRLRDPRLSLTCRNRGDEPLAFAWIQPSASTAYVVVARRGYDEAYPVRGTVPVRVMSVDVDGDRSSAVFSVTEHAQDGTRVAAYELEARVSG